MTHTNEDETVQIVIVSHSQPIEEHERMVESKRRWNGLFKTMIGGFLLIGLIGCGLFHQLKASEESGRQLNAQDVDLLSVFRTSGNAPTGFFFLAFKALWNESENRGSTDAVSFEYRMENGRCTLSEGETVFEGQSTMVDIDKLVTKVVDWSFEKNRRCVIIEHFERGDERCMKQTEKEKQGYLAKVFGRRGKPQIKYYHWVSGSEADCQEIEIDTIGGEMRAEERIEVLIRLQ